jgi:hypothetical protein
VNAERHIDAVARLRALCVAADIAVSIAGFVRERDVARLLGVTGRTLRTWRYDGCGPPATRIGHTHWSSETTARVS